MIPECARHDRLRMFFVDPSIPKAHRHQSRYSSERSVYDDWKFARAWLLNQLRDLDE